MADELIPKLSAEEARNLAKDILVASANPSVGEVWNGPRSNEVGFTTQDGQHVLLAVRLNI